MLAGQITTSRRLETIEVPVQAIEVGQLLVKLEVMLFHVSEESGIERFEPRASEDGRGPVVWAIDAGRLRNHLLPRECPRDLLRRARNHPD
jgi:hypothetical protein